MSVVFLLALEEQRFTPACFTQLTVPVRGFSGPFLCSYTKHAMCVLRLCDRIM